MATDAPKIPTFALHMNGWKRAVFQSFFPERRFVYLPLNVTAEAFERKWMARIAATRGAEVFIWGHNLPANLETFVRDRGIPCFFIEDGFLRSNRPNAARTPPLSLSLDSRRPYFDSRGPSDLEVMLETHDFSGDPDLLERAREGIRLIVEGGLSKYNMVSSLSLADLLGEKTKPRVLVIGQVEDDASILYGCDRKFGNNDLVRLAAAENPGAEILYKPHPDILNGVRDAQSDPQEVAHLCRILREKIPLARSFETIDKAYAITSLGGFEALLRGIPLTVLGCPFYAGWGLTDDRQPNPRRTRRRTVEEVFAAAYLRYPTYFEPVTGARSTFEQTVEWLKLRLENPEKYRNEFGDAKPDEWRPWGAYGILGWRHLLPFILIPLIGWGGNRRLVEKYRANPIRFFRERTSLKARIVGRVLYPFDARK
ncbi:cell surface protein [Shinella sp. SUS2]|uniref:capsular polysaccharide export protein, LipB/KpsS family n=1 Tax=unclassified Shinella TaxID=2643062 RepID=UPI0006821DB5|nr:MULTISPECIES: capsular polysaccharide biosynthesis protein [unclassified Shinella]KNY13345.1 cell surface protein [Shinella sp. SUS2]KOC72207.1 cell surface protein [Shinella sp. GWS1]